MSRCTSRMNDLRKACHFARVLKHFNPSEENGKKALPLLSRPTGTATCLRYCVYLCLCLQSVHTYLSLGLSSSTRYSVRSYSYSTVSNGSQFFPESTLFAYISLVTGKFRAILTDSVPESLVPDRNSKSLIPMYFSHSLKPRYLTG
jgi:hypothetical protein